MGQIVSGLCGLPVKTVEKVVREISLNGLDAEAARSASSSGQQVEETVTHQGNPKPISERACASDKEVMVVLVRQALFNAVRGRPHSDFPGDILNLRNHGIFVGTTNHSERFPPVVETAAARLLRSLQLTCLGESLLAGLGIPSDFECVADGGTLGRWYSRASETFLLIGVVLSTPSGSRAMFLDAANEQCDSRGPQHGQRIFDVLRQTFGLSIRSRLACFCGDGQLVRGGPGASHPSTDAAKFLWRLVQHREERSIWDPFHLFDSLSRSFLEEPIPTEMILGCFECFVFSLSLALRLA